MTSDKRHIPNDSGFADFVNSLRLAEGDPAALIGAFQRAGDAASGEEIADLLWLWLRLRERSRAEQAVEAAHEATDQTAEGGGAELIPDDEPAIKLNVAVEHEAVEPPEPEDQQTGDAPRGATVNVPAAPALLHSRELLHALRPLKRRVPARGKLVLDEQASVQRSADEGRLVTVFRPPQERWLSVDLVVDQSAAMVLWHATVRELQRLLAHSGLFRDVRLWSLDAEAQPQEEQDNVPDGWLLPIHPGLRRRESSTAHSPRELNDPNGRRLILLVSDAVSLGWQRGLVAQTIAAWSRTNPVVLIHMLPKNHWQRTALGDATEVLLEAPRPGAPNAHLRAQRLLRWPGRSSEVPGVKLPVVTLEPHLLLPWARSLASAGGLRVPGYVLSPTTSARHSAPAEAGPEVDPNTLVERFLRYASPTARELALLLAAAPLTLPVINLVRAALLPHAEQTHVAEVLLSGLLYQRPTPADADPDHLIFEFHPGVRDLLLERAPLNSVLQVIAQVGQYLERINISQSIQATAHLSLEILDEPRTNENEEPKLYESKVFAKIQAKLLQKLGYGHTVPATNQISINDEGLEILVKPTTLDREYITPEAFKVLIVENDKRWSDTIKEILEEAYPKSNIDQAFSLEESVNLVKSNQFDLVITEVFISETPTVFFEPILEAIRGKTQAYGCGIVALSALENATSIRAACKRYAVHCIISKIEYDDQEFIDATRSAIVNARIDQAELRDEQRNKLTFFFGFNQLRDSVWSSPKYSSTATAARPVKFDTDPLIQSGDEISVQKSNHQASWRAKARSVGKRLYQLLTKEAAFQDHITSNHTSAIPGIPPQIQFVGPAPILGLPLELIRSGNIPFCQEHILSRKISGVAVSRKPEPFHRFVREHIDNNRLLRILVIGSNIGNTIPSADQEIDQLSSQIRADLDVLGIRHHIRQISGAEANPDRISEAIQHGGYHILHYAGHSGVASARSELSALTLRQGAETYNLTPAVLQSLLRGTEIRLVFLNCCLSAHTAAQIGQGDFHGMLDALADADVPIVISYRWSVPEESARELALRFYRALWRTFSPGEALLEARRHMALASLDPDDETWAAPVLVMQNS